MKVKIMQVGPIGTNCYFLMEEEEKVLAIIDPGDEASGSRLWQRRRAAR